MCIGRVTDINILLPWKHLVQPASLRACCEPAAARQLFRSCGVFVVFNRNPC